MAKVVVEFRQEGRRVVADVYMDGLLTWQGLSTAGLRDIMTMVMEGQEIKEA